MALIDDQFDAALAELKLRAQPDVPPALDSTELKKILCAAQRASYWAASTVYGVGQVVLPTTRNGRRYRVIQAGTSGSTEPVWSAWLNAQISDGTSDPQLVFEEAGPDWENVYDVDTAVYQALQTKARKAAALMASGGAQGQQVYEHWRKEADRARPLKVA